MRTSDKVEYRAYHDAKQRCNNPSHKRYADWGGRGIEFKFNSFEEFYNEVGPRPNHHSIDRISNEGHYEVGNVKWSSRSDQQHNKRAHHTNKIGVSGVRKIKAKGLVTPSYQAHITVNGIWKQLYAGPSLVKAIEARSSYLNQDIT